MLQGKDKGMRKDQKGFTIVELLIAIAILSIVVAAVCGFILVGSRSYASANSDISVQQEAQLALNQMSDVLIDTTRSVNYVGYDASGSPTLVLKDSEFGFEPAEKSLIMYNGTPVVTAPAAPGGASTTTIEPGNGNKHYHFYWNKNEETLYYTELDVQPDDVDADNNINVRFPAFGDPGWVVLAEHVTKFEVDLTQVEEKRVVQLDLTFVDGKREYNTSNNVTIRNKVGVNDAEIGPLNRKKTLSIIARETAVILEPGETYHFSTPKVTGENVTDKSVTWSLKSAGSPSGGTGFTDEDNGILKVATDEPGGMFEIEIKTKAVDSEGKHAFCTIQVYIKRVTNVNLFKSNDTNEDNGENEISPGCTFTITANVTGSSTLGQTCSACGDDPSIDKYVSWEGNPYGNPYVWQIVDPKEYDPSMEWWNPKDYLKLIDQDQNSATFYLEPDTPDDGTFKFVIQAMSLLSTQGNEHGREYSAWVPEAIELVSVKGKENAQQFSGMLQYGMRTRLDELWAGLSTDHSRYVAAVRVVDNNHKDPDKILLYYTIGGGNNYWVSPDLFDLDLNGSYTFYMQALDPVSNENRKKYNNHEVGSVIEDDAEAIRKEYFAHLDPKPPYGYIGDKYPHNPVYYSRLDKPVVTFEYKGVLYKGKPVTYDPVNVYASGLTLVGGIYDQVKGFANIEGNAGHDELTFSLYEGEGNDSSQWREIYYYDEATAKANPELSIKECYQGTKEFAGKVTVDPYGSIFMKLENQGDILGACGNYHIMPGLVHQSKDSKEHEIIGWEGFDFPTLPREKKYYELDASTIHVKVTSEFTMEINDDWFKGKVLFPLPSQMAGNVLFPNIQSTEWQTSAGSWSGVALKDGQSNSENIDFTYVRYRYSKENKAYYVEPVKVDVRAGENKIVTHSYGTYWCGENGTKWEFHAKGYTSEKELIFTVKDFEYNGRSWQTYFPMPDDSDFPFLGGAQETYYSLSLYQSNNLYDTANLSGVLVKCTKNGDDYTIQFIKKTRANNVNNHKITVVSYGTYSCSKGQKEWTKQKGFEQLPDEKDPDWVVNLQGLQVNGQSYKMYFPLPTEADFPFKGTSGQIENTKYLVWKVDDTFGESPQDLYNIYVGYEKTGDVYKITFANPWDHSKVYGTFQYKDGDTTWTGP